MTPMQLYWAGAIDFTTLIHLKMQMTKARQESQN